MNEAQFSDTLLEISAKLDIKRYVHGSKITYITPLLQGEYLICTTNLLLHLKEDGTVQEYNYKFYSCIYIKQYNIIVGVSVGVPYLIILNNVIGFPIINDSNKISNVFITQMYYYKNRLILLGSEFQIYSFNIKKGHSNFSHKYKADLLISYPFKGPVCNPRFFLDIPKQRIILPTLDGFSIITLDGDIVYDKYQLTQSSFRTCAVTCKPIDKFSNPKSLRKPFTRFLCINNEGKIMIVNQHFQLVSSFQHYGMGFIYAEFMSYEYVLLVSNDYKVALLDIKSNRYLELFQLPSNPDFVRVFHQPDIAAFCMQYTLHVYSLTIPWNLWFRFPANITSIDRHLSAQNLPVISCLCDDSIFSIIDPNSMHIINSTGTRDIAKINKVIYDRGIITEGNDIYYTRSPELGSMEKIDERIFMIRDNNTIMQEYSEGGDFDPVGIAPVRTQIMCIGKTKDDPCVFFATRNSEILSFSYPEMEQINRHKLNLDDDSILDIYYHNKSSILFVATKNELIELDHNTLSVIKTIQTDHNDLVKFDTCYCMLVKRCDYATIYKIGENTEPIIRIPCPAIITSITMCNDMFAFATKERIIYFGKLGSKFARFRSPFNITSIGILNDQLDLLIGCEHEIMLFKPQLYFRYITKPIDYEEQELDDSNEENNSSRKGTRKSARMSRKMSRKQSRNSRRLLLSSQARQRTLEEIILLENPPQKDSSDSDSDSIEQVLKHEAQSGMDKAQDQKKKLEESQRKFKENEIREGYTARRKLRGLLKRILTLKDDDLDYRYKHYSYTPNSKENGKRDDDTDENPHEEEEEDKGVYLQKHDSFFATEMEGETAVSPQGILKKKGKRGRTARQKKYAKIKAEEDSLLYDKDGKNNQANKQSNTKDQGQGQSVKTVRFALNNDKNKEGTTSNSSLNTENNTSDSIQKNSVSKKSHDGKSKRKKHGKGHHKNDAKVVAGFLEDQENYTPVDFNTPDTKQFQRTSDETESSEYYEQSSDAESIISKATNATKDEYDYEYYSDDETNNSASNKEGNKDTNDENGSDTNNNEKKRKRKKVVEPPPIQVDLQGDGTNGSLPDTPRRKHLKNAIANSSSEPNLDGIQDNLNNKDKEDDSDEYYEYEVEIGGDNDEYDKNKNNDQEKKIIKKRKKKDSQNKEGNTENMKNSASNNNNEYKILSSDSTSTLPSMDSAEQAQSSSKTLPHFPEGEKGRISPRFAKKTDFNQNGNEGSNTNGENGESAVNEFEAQHLSSSSPKFEIPLYSEANEQSEYESLLQQQWPDLAQQKYDSNVHHSKGISCVTTYKTKLPPLRPTTLFSKQGYENDKNPRHQPPQTARDGIIPRRDQELFRMTNIIGEQEYPKVPLVSKDYLMDLMFAQKEKLEPIGPIGSTKPPEPSNAIYDLRLMKQIFRTNTKKSHLRTSTKPTGNLDLAFCIVKPTVKKPSSKYKKHRFV